MAELFGAIEVDTAIVTAAIGTVGAFVAAAAKWVVRRIEKQDERNDERDQRYRKMCKAVIILSPHAPEDARRQAVTLLNGDLEH